MPIDDITKVEHRMNYYSFLAKEEIEAELKQNPTLALLLTSRDLTLLPISLLEDVLSNKLLRFVIRVMGGLHPLTCALEVLKIMKERQETLIGKIGIREEIIVCNHMVDMSSDTPQT